MCNTHGRILVRFGIPFPSSFAAKSSIEKKNRFKVTPEKGGNGEESDRKVPVANMEPSQLLMRVLSK